MLAAGVAHPQVANLGRVVTHVSLGLNDHLPGAAELVEVVDVERAEIDLQRREDIVRVDAHRLALIAVEVDEKLRRVGAEDREQLLDDLAIFRIGENAALPLLAFGLVVDLRRVQRIGDGVLEQFARQELLVLQGLQLVEHRLGSGRANSVLFRLQRRKRFRGQLEASVVARAP